MSPNQTARKRISTAVPGRDNQAPAGIIGSVALHGLVVAATFFTWQHRLDITQQPPPVVPVQLVTLADKTNIKPAVKKAEPEKLEPKPVPKIEPQENFDKPEPVQAQAPEKLDVPPEPAPKKTEPAPSEPAPKTKPPPATPKERPKPKKQAEKKKKFDINNVLALLDKQEHKQAPANAKTADRNIKGIGQQNAMTMDLVDSLRNQIAQCWSVPAGAPHPERLIVNLEVFLNPDGSIAQAPQLDSATAAAAGSDPFMRAAADAAKRAIYVCAPYKLPADRYAIWRDLSVTFDPRAMMGQ